MHVLAPSGFRTALVDYTTLCAATRAAFENSPRALRRFYGKHYVHKCKYRFSYIVSPLLLPLYVIPFYYIMTDSDVSNSTFLDLTDLR